ncbi:MAG TPA: arabinogalactan endo-1,4-beta-galactosidase [Saprospirales bacterium]|nr:arabinogalactan endo-1,4-beta-galactosidase [Saprospirales bacterium]
MISEMKQFPFLFAIFFVVLSCNGNGDDPTGEPVNKLEIKGADMSYLPEIRESGLTFFNEQDKPEEMLLTLKNAGVNVIRLRLWHNPIAPNSDFGTVKTLAEEIRSKGFKLLLSVQYSDTWADPGHQTKPGKWNNLNFAQLKDSVYHYTKKIVEEIQPEYIQIGNEINGGFLWPEGRIANLSQFTQLLQSGIQAVRDHGKGTKIMIHYAGFQHADWFYTQLAELDYDIIGLSYYPVWHGKDLEILKTNLTQLPVKFSKKIMIAETSYPWTFSWNDATTNIIGSAEQILPEFPASFQGQKNFLQKISDMLNANPNAIGFCYWGSEWVSYKGKDATNGSSYENQAFWDFTNSSLPVLEVYK